MILADYRCPRHGDFEQMVESPSPDFVPCPADPGRFVMAPDGTYREAPCCVSSPWVPFPVRGSVRIGEVQRGTVDRPDSPMYLDTRELGNGMPYTEWRDKRDKMYEERRHRESKDL